jgi:hypothetical protein
LIAPGSESLIGNSFSVLASNPASRASTCEQMETVEERAVGIRDDAVSATGLTATHLETYEVAVHA